MRSPTPEYPSAEPFLPKQPTLRSLKEAAKSCQGCPLYKNATQTVFGEGRVAAVAMFIGEQPGDQEDRAGRPFVGPAGAVLDEGLQQAGIDRDAVYVTNAVKHFKWELRGKRRIHAKPTAREMAACKPWLLAELEVVKPRLVVCLGATAAQSLMGPAFRITRDRGQIFTDTPYAPALMATYHPSAILRAPDPQSRRRMQEEFVQDLEVAKKHLKEGQGGAERVISKK